MVNVITFRKAVVFTLIVALLAWTIAAYAISVTQVVHAAVPGDLIKMDGNAAVYFLGSDNKRYVFPNQKTFDTWFPDFSSVVNVSQSELESYPIGGNVTYRPGTRLVKITTDPKVYAVEPGGTLRWVSTETIATDLYGSDWNQRIDDVPDPFFVNYTTGSDLTDSTYPTGSLVSPSGDATIYYIDGSEKRAFADEAAFNANNFKWTDVIDTTQDLSGFSAGSSVTGNEGDLSTIAGPEVSGGSSSSSVGTLSATLAPDTPAAATVVKNAAQVRFSTFNFTASGGDVTIDKMMIERTGLSQDSNFTDIIILDEDTGEQIGNEKSLGSEHTATFNDDIIVKNGTTRKISLGANMAATLQAGEVAVLALNSITLAGSATMSGSFPIAGNGMTMNNTVTIGTLTIAAGGSNPSASTQKIGTNDYIVSSVKLTGATEDIWVHKMRFYNNGTAADSDMANLDLVLDGTVIKTEAAVNDKEVIFDLGDNPVEIKKGTNKEFSLRLDIVDGSNRTISMDFEKKIDVTAKGETFGFYVSPTYPNTTTPYFNANDTTIDLGALTVSKGVISSLNVAEGGTQQVLGAFKFNAQGESIQVTKLGVEVSVSGTGNAADVTNVTWYDENGAVVAGPVDPGTSGDKSATTTDTFIVPVGIHTYMVKGDLNSDFAQGDTIQLKVDTPALNVTAKGDVTNQTVTPSPSSTVSGDTLTVKVGSISASTDTTPSAQSVIIGQGGFVFANFVLDAGSSGEDVRVTQMAIAHKTSANSIQTNLANLQLYDGTTALDPIVQPSAVAATTATSTFSFTNPVIVPKGSSKTLTLKADVNAGSAGQTHKFSCLGAACITATGADTSNSVTATVTNSDGQVMTLASSGTLTVADDASNPTADLLVAGSSKVTVGELRLTATNEDVDLTEIHFTASAVNSGSLKDEFTKLFLYDGATQVSSLTPTTSLAATFSVTDGDFRVAKGSAGKKLTVKADIASIQTGSPAESGRGLSLAVAEDNYVAKGISSGTKLGASAKSGTFAGNQFSVFKTLPTLVVENLSSYSLVNGNDIDLIKFEITADSNGDVGFYKATFDVATSVATVTNFKLTEYNADGSTGKIDVTANGSRGVDEAISASTFSPSQGGTHRINLLMDTGTDGIAQGGEYRIIASGQTKQYNLSAKIANSVSGSSVSTKLVGDNAFPSSYPSSAGNGIDGDTNDSFIWSDLNVGNNSSTATQTAEWFNGYRVFSTTTSQTLSR